MRPAKSRYDAIVVGGGHNGLVASFYLAQAGLDVLVVERRERMGGVCAPLEPFPGYRGAITNTPSSLEPLVASDMKLSDFGLVYDRPDPTMVFPLENGQAFRGWRDRAKVRTEIERIAPDDVDAYFEVLALFDRLAGMLGASVLDAPPTLAQVVSGLRGSDDEALFNEVFFGSIAELLDRRLKSPHLKALLASLSMGAGNIAPSTPGSPVGLLRRPLSVVRDDVPADDPRRSAVRGSTGLPRGGMGTIVEAMERSARARGVEMLVETGVASIATRAGRAAGVVTYDGEHIEADLVLSTLNPKTTLLDLVPAEDVPDSTRVQLENLKMSGGAYKLILALDGLPRHVSAADENEVLQLASCQYRYSPTVEYLERAHDDYKNGRFSARPKLLGLTPSVMDPTLTPEGRHIMSVSVWFAPYELEGRTWNVQTKHEFDSVCLDTMEEFIPNIRDITIDTASFSPLDLEQQYGLVGGHQLHGEMTPSGLFSRPVPSLTDYRTSVSGLYLSGSGSWPGGTVTGLPGHNAAHTALRDRRLRNPNGYADVEAAAS